MAFHKNMENDWKWVPDVEEPMIASDEALFIRKANGRAYRASMAAVKQFVNLQNTIFVTDPDQLLDIDSTKNYMIDGVIDLGARSITIPEGGLSISGLNGARDTSKLITSEDNHTLFVTGTYSGGIVMESLTITVDGTGSKVFDIDNAENSGAIDITGVNFTGCTSLGELTDYRQIFFDGCGFINIGDGLTFNGTWNGLVATNSIAIGSSDFTMFSEGVGLTFSGSIRADMNFLNVTAGSTFMDFAESDIVPDAGVLLNGFRTAATDSLPNLPSSSTKVRYSRCTGIRDTYVGGQWTITTPAATSIAASNTKYKAAGGVTYTDLQWFTSGGDNAMTYDSSEDIEVEIKAVLTLSGTNNDQANVCIRQYDASAAGYVDLSSSGAATLNASGRAEGVAVFGYATLNEGDRLELWIENLTGARDITVQSGGLFGVVER
ncbi:MAG: hypothetical protein ACPG4X_21560 [Pikeienuella sp.]